MAILKLNEVFDILSLLDKINKIHKSLSEILKNLNQANLVFIIYVHFSLVQNTSASFSCVQIANVNNKNFVHILTRVLHGDKN